MTALRLVDNFLIYPPTRCTSKCCDIIKWHHNHLLPLFQWEGQCTCAGELPWFACTSTGIPAELYPTATHGPICLFHNLNFESVTHIWGGASYRHLQSQYRGARVGSRTKKCLLWIDEICRTAQKSHVSNPNPKPHESSKFYFLLGIEWNVQVCT